MKAHLSELSGRRDSFRRLSEKTGKESLIWRYSLIMPNGLYKRDFHLDCFGKIAETLAGDTQSCKSGFPERCLKIRKRMQSPQTGEADRASALERAKQMAKKIAGRQGMALMACGKPATLGRHFSCRLYR